MQAASLVIAAVFSLIAIGGSFFQLPTWMSVVSLVVAGLFLALALYDRYSKLEQEPIELDAEQRQTIRRMKKEGNHDLAIRQVQMWFRNADNDTAASVVREV